MRAISTDVVIFYEAVNDHMFDKESFQSDCCDNVIIASGWTVDGYNDLVQGQDAMASCECKAVESYGDDSKV